MTEIFKTNWNMIFKSVEMAVNWGLAHRNIDRITAIGIDEICWRKRKDKFVTLVYQLDRGKRRLIWIGPDRTAKTFREFFDCLGTARQGLGNCGIFAVTCGNPIWPSLPKRQWAPSIFSTDFIA
nr:transposase [uncultured Desulfobulbus sp.]